MTQEFDDFDELEALLNSARAHALKMQQRGALRATARNAKEVSGDYAERLAERATFRRLLSDEALDGVRFRYLFQHGMGNIYERWCATPSIGIDNFRKMIDDLITKEESKRG